MTEPGPATPPPAAVERPAGPKPTDSVPPTSGSPGVLEPSAGRPMNRRTRDASPGESYGFAIAPPYRPPPLRAVLGILAIFALFGGVLYPLAVDGFARGTGGFDAVGGFVLGGDPAQLANDQFGQNITDPSLFWLRPSLTDYNATLGSGESPFGPTDPNLVNLTLYYLGVYGLNGTTAPLELVSNSASGLDPDLDPAALLVQVPRVAAHANLSEPFLMQMIEARVQQPALGLFGAPIVNVIALDQDLLKVLATPAA